MPKPSPKRAEIARIKWVIGVPYAVQGTTSLLEVPVLYFIKFVLGMGDVGGQLFDSLRSVGWFLKPIWGFISDRVALFGYHRKSWFVLMAGLGVAFWLLNAALAAAEIRIPLVYLITFNLAFATYAFVDVVCDAVMVTQGRRLGRVGSFVNFQWTVLAVANAGAVLLGSWLQTKIGEGDVDLWIVFVGTAVPPLLTAAVGLFALEEDRQPRAPRPRRHTLGVGTSIVNAVRTAGRGLMALPGLLKRERVLMLLVLFIFFWKFRPSIGFIERSYLIDVRGFQPTSFGTILAVGSVTFLVSIVTYRWIVTRFKNIDWHEYLYAMIAIQMVSFPLSFYFYIQPDHAWWAPLEALVPQGLALPFDWNRYEWARLVFETILGFALIPAFMIPLTIAGETVKVAYAGLAYAFLTSLSNVTTMFEGMIGAALYDLFRQPFMAGVRQAFQDTPFNIAGSADERTLILEMFVYVGLAFTLLAIPFVVMLKRELESRGVRIRLGGEG